jgi:tetratricopeptide (TPR) repeat protein
VARDALQRCRAAEAENEPERERLLEDGLKLAEEAVAADDEDAEAHFALFCNLAEQVRRQGVGPSTLFDLRRARRELDRALEIAPSDPELLAAKGAVLLSLPGFLGGDPDEAQGLLLRAFIADPDNHATRTYLEQVPK